MKTKKKKTGVRNRTLEWNVIFNLFFDLYDKSWVTSQGEASYTCETKMPLIQWLSTFLMLPNVTSPIKLFHCYLITVILPLL